VSSIPLLPVVRLKILAQGAYLKISRKKTNVQIPLPFGRSDPRIAK